MHKWLVKNGWVIDAKTKFGMFMTYLAFAFIPGAMIFALLNWLILTKTDIWE